MTLLETIVSLAIALSFIAGVMEASRLAISRSAIALLDVEAATKVEKLHLRIGADLSLEPGHREGSDEGGIRWSVDIRPYLPAAKGPKAFEVTANVSIKRGGLSVQHNVATLKLKPEHPR